MQDFKLNKDEILYTVYCDNNGRKTHVISKKLNTDINKMWILLSVEPDGSLKKVAHGANPLKLEDKIGYIKAAKDT